MCNENEKNDIKRMNYWYFKSVLYFCFLELQNIVRIKHYRLTLNYILLLHIHFSGDDIFYMLYCKVALSSMCCAYALFKQMPCANSLTLKKSKDKHANQNWEGFEDS